MGTRAWLEYFLLNELVNIVYDYLDIFSELKNASDKEYIEELLKIKNINPITGKRNVYAISSMMKKDCLTNAVSSGNEILTKVLLDNMKEDENIIIDENLILYAVTKGHDNVVKLLLEEKAGQPNVLFYATFGGYDNVVKTLIRGRAVVDHTTNETLVCAAMRGHVSIVKLLLDNGADISVLNTEFFRYTIENGFTLKKNEK